MASRAPWAADATRSPLPAPRAMASHIPHSGRHGLNGPPPAPHPQPVIAALVAAIQRKAGSGARGWLDCGDKPRNDMDRRVLASRASWATCVNTLACGERVRVRGSRKWSLSRTGLVPHRGHSADAVEEGMKAVPWYTPGKPEADFLPRRTCP